VAARGERLHRAVDVVGAAAGLVVLAPVIVAVALAVRLRMGGPVLFRQERAGRDGTPFVLLKFRTMAVPRGAADEDPDRDGLRTTPLGRRLRATSLDELPSLLNVLRGDMALVGPRPLPTRYLDRYSAAERERLEVRPGLTGWAQVNGRNAVTWDERFALDRWYVAHRSLRLDLRIVAATVGTVLRHEGIGNAEHATMPELRPLHERTGLG
jgi:lipopolysaccharide/colanic/teichoic acid biosynthesis glycosyltransferase